jgi:hypothetical protein
MSSGKEGYQFFLRRVDELIDRFMGDRALGEISGDPAGDKFWRPSEFDFLKHIIPDGRIF